MCYTKYKSIYFLCSVVPWPSRGAVAQGEIENEEDDRDAHEEDEEAGGPPHAAHPPQG